MKFDFKIVKSYSKESNLQIGISDLKLQKGPNYTLKHQLGEMKISSSFLPNSDIKRLMKEKEDNQYRLSSISSMGSIFKRHDS